MATRKEEIKKYNEAKKLYQEAYATASDDVKQKVQDVMSESRGRTSADPLNNRDARQYATQMYENALAILNGNYVESPEAETPRRKALTGYNLAGNITNANNVTNYGLHHPEQRTSSTSNPSNTNTTVGNSNTNGTYFFNWQDGLSSTWGNTNDTLSTKIVRYAQALMENLSNAQDANSQGKKMRKISQKQLGFLNDDIAKLSNILQRAGSDPEGAYNDLISVATHYDPDGDHFKAYFGNLAPGQSELDQKIKAIRDKGFTDYDLSGESQYIRDLLGSKYKFFKDKSGQIYAYDNDYNQANVTDFVNLDDGENYGHGYFITDDGKIFMGNTADINDQHWANDYWNGENGLLAKLKDINGKHFTSHIYDTASDYSDSNLINEFIKTKGDAATVNYTDVSALFKDNRPVIAYTQDGKEVSIGNFGELRHPENLIYVWQSTDGKSLETGNLTKATEALGGFNKNGYEENGDQTGALYSLNNVFEGIEGISNDSNLRKTDFKNALIAGGIGAATGWKAGAATGSMFGGIGAVPGTVVGAIVGFIGGAGADLVAQYLNNSTIGDDPAAFVDIALKAIEHPKDILDNAGVDIPGINRMTGSQFLANLGGKQKVIAKIGELVDGGDVELPAELKKEFYAARRKYYSVNKEALREKVAATKHAEGGILNAARGSELYMSEREPQHTNDWHEKFSGSKEQQKEDADIEKAKEEGYDDVNLWRANKNTKLTAADTMRIGAIAADVVSIAASFASGTGAGAVVAETAGLASFGTNTIADLIDPSVKAREVIKNTAIGAGLAAISFIPGAKIGSTTAKVIKYAPKIMMAAGAMGIAMDQSTHETFKKVIDGKEKLNTQDWKNLAHVMMLVSAGTRGGRSAYEKRAANKTYKAKGPIDIVIDGKSVGTISSAEQKTAFTKAAKLAQDGKADEAAKVLADAKIKINGKELTADSAKELVNSPSKPLAKVASWISGKKGNLDADLKQSFNYEEAANAYETLGSNSKYDFIRNRPTWKQKGIMLAADVQNAGTAEGTAAAIRAKMSKVTTNPEEAIVGNTQSSAPVTEPQATTTNASEQAASNTPATTTPPASSTLPTNPQATIIPGEEIQVNGKYYVIRNIHGSKKKAVSLAKVDPTTGKPIKDAKGNIVMQPDSWEAWSSKKVQALREKAAKATEKKSEKPIESKNIGHTAILSGSEIDPKALAVGDEIIGDDGAIYVISNVRKAGETYQSLSGKPITRLEPKYEVFRKDNSRIMKEIEASELQTQIANGKNPYHLIFRDNKISEMELQQRLNNFPTEINGHKIKLVSFKQGGAESPLITNGHSNRTMVLVDIDGQRVPFYISSGAGGKVDVQAHQWYPFFGIDPKMGWMNKLSGSTGINDFYGSKTLQEIAKALNTQIGMVQNQGLYVPVEQVRSLESFVNSGIPKGPIENGTSQTKSHIQENIDIILKHLKEYVAPPANRKSGGKINYNKLRK